VAVAAVFVRHMVQQVSRSVSLQADAVSLANCVSMTRTVAAAIPPAICLVPATAPATNPLPISWVVVGMSNLAVLRATFVISRTTLAASLRHRTSVATESVTQESVGWILWACHAAMVLDPPAAPREKNAPRLQTAVTEFLAHVIRWECFAALASALA
jgi:hypothetical protein